MTKIDPVKAGMQEGMERPLVGEENKLPPVKQIYNGFEIEARYLLMDTKKDYTKSQNAIETYNEVLEKGTSIKQGYIKDFAQAREVLEELGIELSFSPNTVRLRKYGSTYILTVKDRKDTKKREVEWEITRQQFNKHWPLTKGSRIEKKRLEKKIKGNLVEIDAFTDRFLLLAEIEVDDESKMDSLPKLGSIITGQSAWTNKSLSK